MAAMLQHETPRESIGEGRERYLTHTDHLMMVVIDFNDGPHAEPDPPHHHPHEQITYVAAGKLVFYLGDEPHELGPGDMMTVPPNIPHTVKVLTDHARVIDSFTPLREEFLKS